MSSTTTHSDKSEQSTKNPEKKSLYTILKEEPYWFGSISQAVFLLIAAAISFYGIWAGLGLLLFFAALTHGLPMRELNNAKQLFQEKNPDKEFELRYRGVSHMPADFDAETVAARAKTPYFDAMVYLFHGLHYVLLFTCLFVVAQTESYWVALLFAVGLCLYYYPVAESYSHEFIHRRDLFPQMLGGSIWACFCYGTFLSEHCMGHHVHVSTPEDPSSAPKNMTIYQFLPRALRKNAINGFKLEAKRLRNRNKGPWSLNNRILWLTGFSFLLLWIFWLVGGSHGVFFFFAQTIGGLLVIETANYVMHYGLERKKLPNGRYERVSPLHSWNREGFTNVGVTNLQRHSDHHAFPRRPYQNLRFFPEAPEFPLPYELLLYMPYAPKLWFKVMNPCVDRHMDKLAKWREAGIDDYQEVMNMDGARIAGNNT